MSGKHAAAALLGLCFSAVSSAAAYSWLLGQPAKQIDKSDFYRFYHLTMDSVTTSGAESTLNCRPGGGPFAQEVRVNITVGSNHRVQGVALTLARSFLEHPKNGIYARDIARYFFRWVPDPSTASQLPDFTRTISATRTIGETRVQVEPSTLHNAPAVTFSLSRGPSAILKHVQPIKPDETKLMKPWPGLK